MSLQYRHISVGSGQDRDRSVSNSLHSLPHKDEPMDTYSLGPCNDEEELFESGSLLKHRLWRNMRNLRRL
jgi:hypothetical protein